MKKEIASLLTINQDGKTTVRLNHVTVIEAVYTDSLGFTKPLTAKELTKIHHIEVIVNVPGSTDTVRESITSREVDGIIAELPTACEKAYKSIADRMVSDIRNGYIRK